MKLLISQYILKFSYMVRSKVVFPPSQTQVQRKAFKFIPSLPINIPSSAFSGTDETKDPLTPIAETHVYLLVQPLSSEKVLKVCELSSFNRSQKNNTFFNINTQNSQFKLSDFIPQFQLISVLKLRWNLKPILSGLRSHRKKIGILEAVLTVTKIRWFGTGSKISLHLLKETCITF